MSHLRAFAAFWYDFLVGDRPELFIGPLSALLLAWLLLRSGLGAGETGVVLVLSIGVVGAVSLWLTTRPRR